MLPCCCCCRCCSCVVRSNIMIIEVIFIQTSNIRKIILLLFCYWYIVVVHFVTCSKLEQQEYYYGSFSMKYSMMFQQQKLNPIMKVLVSSSTRICPLSFISQRIIDSNKRINHHHHYHTRHYHHNRIRSSGRRRKEIITTTFFIQQKKSEIQSSVLLSRIHQRRSGTITKTPTIIHHDITKSPKRYHETKLKSRIVDDDDDDDDRISNDSTLEYNNERVNLHHSDRNAPFPLVLQYNPDTITSMKSNTMKKVQSLLKNRKKRYEYSQTIIEGPRIIYDLLLNPDTSLYISQIIISIDMYDIYISKINNIIHQQNEQHETTCNNDNNSDQQSQHHTIEIIKATSDVIQSCTDTVTNQGIIAICQIPTLEQQQYNNNQQQQNVYNLQRIRPLYVVFDHVSDPGNIGTLIRSAVGAGIQEIYCINNTCDPYNPKAIRSAMGTTFLLPIIQSFNNWNELYNHFIDTKNICSTTNRIYAATMLEEQDQMEQDLHDEATPKDIPLLTSKKTNDMAYYEVDWCCDNNNNEMNIIPSVLIIGNEGNGLSDDIRKELLICNNNDQYYPIIQPIHIPMMSSYIESLNAAVCGSIIMFEYNRQILQKAKKKNKHMK